MGAEQQSFDFDLAGGQAAGGSESGYSDDRAILADYFRLFQLKLPVIKRLQRGIGRTGELDHLKIAERRIEVRLHHSRARGEGGWLIAQFRRYRLPPQERMMVALLCYLEARNAEAIDPGDLVDVVCDCDRVKMIGFRSRITDGALVFKTGLLAMTEPGMPFGSGHWVRLGDAVKAHVFGVYEHQPETRKDDDKPSPSRVQPLRDVRNPRQIYDELSRHVIGQEAAKQAVAVALYQHHLLITGKASVEKANLMLVGPTGCGKTYIVEIAAKLLGVPFVTADATQLTELGYVGMSVEDLFKALYKAAGDDPKRTAQGIIFIDEIDKVAATGEGNIKRTNRDISGECVQQDLLRAIEGGGMPGRPFDASNVMFIAGGAFSGMERKALKAAGTVGFGNRDRREAAQCLPELDDFVAYGMLPELMGRFQSVVFMDQLDRKALVRILTEPDNSLASQYRKMFAGFGLDLQLPQETLEAIAAKAERQKTGARALKSVFNGAVSPLMFSVIGKDGAKVVTLTPDMI